MSVFFIGFRGLNVLDVFKFFSFWEIFGILYFLVFNNMDLEENKFIKLEDKNNLWFFKKLFNNILY